MVDIKSVRKQLNKELAEKKYLQEQLLEQENNLQELKKYDRALEKVRGLFQEAATLTQKKLEYHISSVVSTALAAIWDDPYEFELEFVSKRGKTEANLWLIRNENKLHPMDAVGGGVIDVVSMALRIAAWTINKNTRPIIILDEPFRNLSENLLNAGSILLKTLCERLNLQIIMVTHRSKLVQSADKIIVIIRGNSGSYVEEEV